MTDLTAWLLAQVAHDEATALADQREALADTLDAVSWPDGSVDDLPQYSVCLMLADAVIAANDPAETLRRCAAVRAVVKLHPGDGYGCSYVCRNYGACPTLTALAGMYAGRDGYAAVVCGG